MYPSIPLGNYLFAYKTAADSDAYWSMNAYFHSQLPKLVEANIFCYYTCYPSNLTEPEKNMSAQIVGTCLGPSQKAQDVQAAMAPIESYLKNSDWGDKISVGGIPTDYPDFTAYWVTQPPQAAGFSGRLGSRILDQKALTSDMQKLKSALRTTTPTPWLMLGHLVAGPGTRSPPNGIPGGSNAVGPAWRSAITLVGKYLENARQR